MPAKLLNKVNSTKVGGLPPQISKTAFPIRQGPAVCDDEGPQMMGPMISVTEGVERDSDGIGSDITKEKEDKRESGKRHASP